MLKDRPVLLLAIGQTLVWAALFYVFPALLVRWEASLGWSRVDLSAAITLAIFLSAAASPVYGRIIDAGRGPLAMALSATAGGIGLLLLSRVGELWQFYAIWALIGLAMSGCLYEPCFALITRARGASAKPAIILITLVAGFASTISFPSAYSLSELFGWRIAVQVFAAAVILVAVPLLWLGGSRLERTGNGPRKTVAPTRATRRAFLARPGFWLLALGFSLGAVAHGVTLQHLLPILDDRGVAPETAVLAASFIGPMQVAGRLAVMAAGGHLSNHRTAVGCFTGMVLAILVLMVSGATPALLALFVMLFGGAYGTLSIVRPVIARDILGDGDFGAKYGAMAALYLAGSASAPFLGALVWRIGGYDLVLPLLVMLAALGLSFYFAADRMARRPA